MQPRCSVAQTAIAPRRPQPCDREWPSVSPSDIDRLLGFGRGRRGDSDRLPFVKSIHWDDATLGGDARPKRWLFMNCFAPGVDATSAPRCVFGPIWYKTPLKATKFADALRILRNCGDSRRGRNIEIGLKLVKQLGVEGCRRKNLGKLFWWSQRGKTSTHCDNGSASRFRISRALDYGSERGKPIRVMSGDRDGTCSS